MNYCCKGNSVKMTYIVKNALANILSIIIMLIILRIVMFIWPVWIDGWANIIIVTLIFSFFTIRLIKGKSSSKLIESGKCTLIGYIYIFSLVLLLISFLYKLNLFNYIFLFLYIISVLCLFINYYNIC